jgi:hypothetical protein
MCLAGKKTLDIAISELNGYTHHVLWILDVLKVLIFLFHPIENLDVIFQ